MGIKRKTWKVHWADKEVSGIDISKINLLCKQWSRFEIESMGQDPNSNPRCKIYNKKPIVFKTQIRTIWEIVKTLRYLFKSGEKRKKKKCGLRKQNQWKKLSGPDPKHCFGNADRYRKPELKTLVKKKIKCPQSTMNTEI